MLKPDTLPLTILLAVLTSLGPLSTDMYLPSLPSIAAHFGRPIADVQLTLSAFFLGFAAGQVFYGPLSDRHGRKRVLLAGLVLFTLATFACALSTSIESLTVMRFCQALGASGPIVLARSIVRDLYGVDRAGAELARMGMIMGLVPAVAPVFGGVFEVLFGWRSSFFAVTLFGVATAAAVILGLPETLRTRAAEPVSPVRIVRTYGSLLTNAGYRGYVMLAAFTFGGMFAFISGSSFVLQGVYGMSPQAYGFAFGFAAFGFIAGTMLAQRLVPRRGLEGSIAVGVAFLAVGGCSVPLGMALGTGSFLEVQIPVMIYTIGLGLTLPQAGAGAMAPFPERAGAASSFLGLCQTSFAALTGIGLGHGLEGRPWALGAAMTVMGLGALLVHLLTRADRAAALAAARARG